MNSRSRSTEAKTYRAMYYTARWKRIRMAILIRDGFKCQQCGRIEADTSKLVANHIKPHKGNADMFHDSANIECVCKPCHDGHVQSLERGGKGRTAIGADGWPIP